MDTLTKLLRISGVGVLIMSVLHYLFLGRQDLNSLEAHSIFLGLNVLLCTLGIFFATKLKEMTTARTFNALSLAMIPAQMAQLGAFINAKFYGVAKGIPDLLTLSLPNGAELSLVIVISLVLLFPIMHFGLLVFSKNYSKSILSTYLLTNTLILLPSRDPLFMLVVLITCALIILFFDRKLGVAKSTGLIIARAISWIPFIVICGRALMHSNHNFYQGSFCLLLGLFFTFVPKNWFDKRNYLFPIKLLGGFFCLIATALFYDAFKFEFYYFFFFLSATLLVFANKHNTREKEIRGLSCLFGLVATISFFVDRTGVLSRSIVLMVPYIFVYLGIKNAEGWPMISGTVVSLTLTFCHLNKIFDFPQLGIWQILAFVGISAVIAGGLIDKYLINKRDKNPMDAK